MNKKIDFVITSVPSYTAHSVGAYLKYVNPNIYWVADYRDLWSGNPIFPGIPLIRWIEKFHEQLLLKKANLLVTINNDLSNSLKTLHNKEAIIIPNGFEADDLHSNSVQKNDQSLSKSYKSIVYTGTVLSGLQNPEPLFLAIEQLIQDRLITKNDIKVFFYGDSSAIIKTNAFNFLLENKIIELKRPVKREDSLNFQREADLLLFLGARQIKGGASINGIVSGKIFEYLISGVEIMGIGVDETMIVGEIIQQAKAGSIYAEDIEKIKIRLIDLVCYGNKQIHINEEYIAQFYRGKQAKILLKHIENQLL